MVELLLEALKENTRVEVLYLYGLKVTVRLLVSYTFTSVCGAEGRIDWELSPSVVSPDSASVKETFNIRMSHCISPFGKVSQSQVTKLTLDLVSHSDSLFSPSCRA